MIRALREWRKRRWTLCKFCPHHQWQHHGVSWGTTTHCTAIACWCIQFVSSGVSLYDGMDEYIAQARRSTSMR